VTLAEGLLAALWVGVTLYAVFAGADFGAGFWDLVAGGPERGAAQRDLIERSIGPVWEANHVWLIFVLVVLWTGFPTVFAAVASTLYVPLTAAAVGVILRGAGFAFRKTVTGVPLRRLFGATFASSSLLTPFFLGTVAGAVASGRVPVEGAGPPLASWTHPTSLLGGILAVATCAHLAAVFLAVDASRAGRTELVEAFRRRALASGVAAGATALAGIAVLRADAPLLFDGLTGRAALLVIGSALGGMASLAFLARRWFRAARVAAVVAVAGVVWGWAVGQYPYLLVDTVTIETGAGARATLVAMAVSLGVGALLFAPALVALLVLAERGRLTGEPSPEAPTSTGARSSPRVDRT